MTPVNNLISSFKSQIDDIEKTKDDNEEALDQHTKDISDMNKKMKGFSKTTDTNKDQIKTPAKNISNNDAVIKQNTRNISNLFNRVELFLILMKK